MMEDKLIEELHEIREKNYENRKNMTFEEEKKEINKKANAVRELIKKARKRIAIL